MNHIVLNVLTLCTHLFVYSVQYSVYKPYIYREYVQNETTRSQKNLYLFHKIYVNFKWPLT